MLDAEGSALLEYGIDVKERAIYIGGEISVRLHINTALGLRILTRDSNQPITIILNSYGGEVCQALAIIEEIQLAKNKAPINTFAIGACQSAGTLILQAGQVRKASKDCSLMVHFGQETNESGSEAKHNSKLTKRMKDIYQERTGKGAKTINKWLDADTYFTAEEALKAKLIDEVVT